MLTLLPCVEIDPPASPAGCVIWLHGLGADGNDFVPIVSELKLNIPLRFVFPHAPLIPVTINNGYVMRAWYDIVSMNMNQHADQVGIDDSVKKLQQLIEREKQSGIPYERIILAGFSQGAVIALTTGLTFQKQLAGIIALSGYLPHSEQVIKTSNPLYKSTPIFIGHGTEDPIVPYPLGEKTYQTLKNYNYTISWHSYTMPHSVCQEEIQDIAKWLTRALEPIKQYRDKF
ncbi:MAG: carboxylesterase [uncultured bacterium]|nr:MAG: carboxylesterase [uncultured bacterium]